MAKHLNDFNLNAKEKQAYNYQGNGYTISSVVDFTADLSDDSSEYCGKVVGDISKGIIQGTIGLTDAAGNSTEVNDCM